VSHQADFVCSIEWCERSCVAKFMCRMHYAQSQLGRKGPCSVEGCARSARTLGLCGMHYTRQRTGPIGPPLPLVAVGTGRSTTGSGYVRLHRPGHPMAHAYGWVLEHRLVAYEAGLIQPGDGNHVHHVNHDPADNRLENLEVVSAVGHAAIHAAERRFIVPEVVAQMYLSGLTTTAIAQQIGTSAGNVSRAMRSVGVTARPWPKGRPDVDRHAIAEQLKAGAPMGRIAKQAGCSTMLVRSLRLELGLPANRPGRPLGSRDSQPRRAS
jgi:uncharacterized protein YerC